MATCWLLLICDDCTSWGWRGEPDPGKSLHFSDNTGYMRWDHSFSVSLRLCRVETRWWLGWCCGCIDGDNKEVKLKTSRKFWAIPHLATFETLLHLAIKLPADHIEHEDTHAIQETWWGSPRSICLIDFQQYRPCGWVLYFFWNAAEKVFQSMCFTYSGQTLRRNRSGTARLLLVNRVDPQHHECQVVMDNKGEDPSQLRFPEPLIDIASWIPLFTKPAICLWILLNYLKAIQAKTRALAMT